MKKISILILFILTAVFIMMGPLFLKPSTAQAVRFDGVVPFATTAGFMGFFDQKDGKIYLYDQDMKECITTAQVETLGAPLKMLQKSK